jgi:serine/threonine-protein kinase HipA
MTNSGALAKRTTKELAVMLYGAPIGSLRSDRNARLSFVYADKARSARSAVPLSLSLPLARREHGHDPVDAFLWGLLPDNENVLARWGREFHVSSRNPFALLAHVGEDCAGAVQIVLPDRVREIEGPGPVRVDWLGESEVAERLAALRRDETAWSRTDDEGRFSLAGAQPKVALFHDRQRWGVPIGRTPTTHILKPPTGAFHGQIEDEHFCLQLARKLGLPVASSRVMRFASEAAIVVERYDRVRMTPAMAATMAATAAAEAAAAAARAGAAGPAEAAAAAADAAQAAARAAGLADLGKTQPVLRLHQEDMCQALGVRPQSKYQNEGGPSPEQIANLLRDHSDDPRTDIDTFADALLFNWLIGGSDGHAKNYSLLHGTGGRVRLAPLYDVASALPYPSLNTSKLKLAMKLGSHYRLRDIGVADLRKLATGMKLNPEALIERARTMSARMPDAARAVATTCKQDGLDHPVLAHLVSLLEERAASCEAQLR